MKTFTRGVAACALALGCLSTATAATICVQNPQTGQFEPRAGSTGDARDCARHNQVPQRDAAQAGQNAPESRAAAAPGAKAPGTAKPIAKSAPAWTLRAGHTIGQELAAWGEKAGWKVVWSMQKDWTIPANTSFEGDFKTAASAVITNLAGNGALVRAQFYDGNNTLVVIGPGVTPQ